jgi:hypothetical protein
LQIGKAHLRVASAGLPVLCLIPGPEMCNDSFHIMVSGSSLYRTACVPRWMHQSLIWLIVDANDQSLAKKPRTPQCTLMPFERRPESNHRVGKLKVGPKWQNANDFPPKLLQ